MGPSAVVAAGSRLSEDESDMTAQQKYRTINLTQGKSTVVDASEYEDLIQFNWFANEAHGVWYAVRQVRVTDKKGCRQRKEWMHRRILGLPLEVSDKKLGDHINGDTLDNRKSNLRVLDKRGNTLNRKTQKNNTSGMRGVCWHKRVGAWQVRVANRGSRLHLGYFSNLENAIQAYKEAAVVYHGKLARFA